DELARCLRRQCNPAFARHGLARSTDDGCRHALAPIRVGCILANDRTGCDAMLSGGPLHGPVARAHAASPARTGWARSPAAGVLPPRARPVPSPARPARARRDG